MSQFDNFEVCIHPFRPFIPEGCKTLIIGTFPTHPRNYKETFPFYYGGAGNVFWEVIGEALNKTFSYKLGDEAKSERENFLRSKQIGVTDMLEKCYRKNGLSQDDYIFPIRFRNLFEVLSQNPTIHTIILTSRTPIVGTRGLFETYLLQHDMSPPEFRENDDKIYESFWNFEGRDIEVLVPYSTSKTIIEKRRATVYELVKMYRLCLT